MSFVRASASASTEVSRFRTGAQLISSARISLIYKDFPGLKSKCTSDLWRYNAVRGYADSKVPARSSVSASALGVASSMLVY